MWVHQLRKPADAPKDGTRFMGIPKYSLQPIEMVWDSEMNCFFTVDFGCVDRLASWYPKKGA